ncbi:hypothetical protein HPB47_009969 [Ixodes persulcatus]|uniref:Uncharacterized protein n=1 Tax=Ixodes persulcatus TaxID=34615 RepID=A0AC60P0C9_IXOPE|nr:hypothetical protein HPB47_009969 [Ixodes persulcatus]
MFRTARRYSPKRENGSLPVCRLLAGSGVQSGDEECTAPRWSSYGTKLARSVQALGGLWSFLSFNHGESLVVHPACTALFRVSSHAPRSDREAAAGAKLRSPGAPRGDTPGPRDNVALADKQARGPGLSIPACESQTQDGCHRALVVGQT